MSRILLVVYLSLAPGAGMFAQTAASHAAEPAKEPARPKEIVALVDQARAAPPEFSADILLKLAGSKLVTDSKWKRELIEEAYFSGAHAQLPYRQVALNISVDARANQEIAANDLEALTLQTRAAEQMLEVDPPRALALFENIVAPTLARPSCEESVAPRTDGYYETAAKVFARAFTAKQREKEEDLHFLETRIVAMRSAAQIYPISKLIAGVRVSVEQRKGLMARFTGALDRVEPSDRIYGDIERVVVPSEIAPAEAAILLPALRAFIVRSVSGPRCSENIKPGRASDSVERFNALALTLDPSGARYKPITPDEAKPGQDDGPRKPQKSWASARSQKMLAAIRWLRFGDPKQGEPPREELLTPGEKATPEWNAHCLDALKLIEGWREDDEASPEDYLIVVAHSYADLVELIPPGPTRESIMGRYLNFLETHYAPTANRNLWFAQVENMFLTARHFADPPEREWLLNNLLRSANPIIALYAKVESLLGPSEHFSGRFTVTSGP